MKKQILTLNVCRCEENRNDLKEGKTYIENKFHNCLNCGYYHNYSEVTIEIDKNKKVIWSTI